MHQIAPNCALSFKIFPGVTPPDPHTGEGDTLYPDPSPLGARLVASGHSIVPPESFILPPETECLDKALVTANKYSRTFCDFCCKHLMAEPKKAISNSNCCMTVCFVQSTRLPKHFKPSGDKNLTNRLRVPTCHRTIHSANAHFRSTAPTCAWSEHIPTYFILSYFATQVGGIIDWSLSRLFLHPGDWRALKNAKREKTGP